MAFSASRAPVGFKGRNCIKPGDEFWVPGVAAASVSEGDLIAKNGVGNTSNAGLFIKATDSLVPCGLVSKRTMTVAANTVGFPVGGPGSEDFLADPSSTSLAKDTLIPCEYFGPYMGIRDVPFGSFTDDVLAAYTAATPSVTLTVALGADDDPNGALIYIYSGAGAGQWNWIVDYANGTKVATLARRFAVAPDTTSNVIILEGEGSGKGGIGCFGRTDCKDENEVDASDGVDDGDFLVMLDARLIGEYMRRGCLPVAKLTFP